MAGELERLLIRIEADTAILRKELERADKQIAGFGNNVDKQLARTERRFQSFSSASSRILSGLAVGYLIKETAQLADSYTNMANRLKFVTDSAEELEAVQRRLFEIAQETRQPLGETTELYARMAFALKATGASQNEVLQFTENLQKALLLSGASGAEASGALVQLSQGLASGTLRGQELNSILEQTPYIASLIAKQMGVTTGELRKLGQEGAITANVLRSAVGGATEELSAQTNKTATTVSQGWNKISNSMMRFVGELNETTGASSELAAVMNLVAESIDGVTNRIGQAAAALKILRGETPTLADALNLLAPNRERGTSVNLNATGADTTSTAPLGEWKTTTEETNFEGVQNRLEQLRVAALEANNLQFEAEQAQYAIELQAWQDHLDAKLISQQEYNEAAANLTSISSRRMSDMTARAYSDMGDRISDTLGSITNAIGGESEKQFAITKAASVATALLKANESVVSSYAAGAALGGPPLGAVYAGMSVAATAAQIAAILSTPSPKSSGGGGSVARVSGGGSSLSAPVASNDNPAGLSSSGPRQAINVTLVGENYTREQVRNLIEGFNDAIADGAVLRVK